MRAVVQTKFGHPKDVLEVWCKGAFAEYASAEPEALMSVPDNLTLEKASAVGVSAFTALRGLRDHGDLQEGQKVRSPELPAGSVRSLFRSTRPSVLK